jgi:peptidyl-Lys metalloendopeptidase
MKGPSKVLPAVACVTVLAGAIAAANAAPERAVANPLRVGLFPTANGAVEVRVTNTSHKAARIPRWQLPQDVLQADLFQVTRDGQPVRYEGAMIKRGLPQAKDFAVLRPGQTWRTVVDLAATYDMAKAGDYTVALASPLQFASLSGGERLQSARGLPMLLKSPALRMWHDGGVAPFAQKLDSNTRGKPCNPRKEDCGGGGGGTGSISFVGCSDSQITTATSAVNAARGYSENAKGYLNTGTVGPRYTTWFGAYTSSRYATANSHFADIDAAMDQNNGEIKINCGCNQSYYAYVYPTRPYEIFVCRAFWSAPLTGTDSKAGTLIHEMSHFNAVAGTDDHVYGQSGAKNLAISDPNAALNNADNHEYFAENTPSQN